MYDGQLSTPMCSVWPFRQSLQVNGGRRNLITPYSSSSAIITDLPLAIPTTEPSVPWEDIGFKIFYIYIYIFFLFINE